MVRLVPLLLLLVANGVLFATEEPAIRLVTENPSTDVRNGRVTAIVKGGVEPYRYQWPNRSTPVTSNITDGVDEGLPITVVVTDAAGTTMKATTTIAPQSIEERLHAFFVPIVDGIASVLFYDPFAAIGVYDPILRDDAGMIRTHPNGTPVTQNIPLVVVWLVLGAVYFTVRMKFINLRGFKHAVDLVRGRYDDPNDVGEVSHFQALTTALSGTVGLGNIAGVAVAISIGGPGATFWMIVAGLLGMTSKFVECTLGVKYRKVDQAGHVSGGPMYYLSRGLKAKGFGRVGQVLGFVFAVLCIGGSLGGGNMFQANQAFAQVANAFPAMAEYGALFGLVMALLVGVVIIGGIKSIANVTDKIVPFMVGIYVLTAIVIIGMNIGNIGHAIGAIFTGAFAPDAMKGGLIGVLIVGFQRAAFSNEAGVGSASIAHSAARTNEPISEGIVALLEPFVDTVVVCTMTALVLIFTGYAEQPNGMTGSALTSAAFTQVFGWFQWILLVAIVLFAFSTMISWSYYGLKAWQYIFGTSKAMDYAYKLMFLGFIVVGASIGLGAVLDFSDMMILGMAFPNILGLLILSGEVRRDLKNYLHRVHTGVIKRHS